MGAAVALPVNNLLFDQAMHSRATVTARDVGKKGVCVAEKQHRREENKACVSYTSGRPVPKTCCFVQFI